MAKSKPITNINRFFNSHRIGEKSVRFLNFIEILFLFFFLRRRSCFDFVESLFSEWVCACVCVSVTGIVCVSKFSAVNTISLYEFILFHLGFLPHFLGINERKEKKKNHKQSCPSDYAVHATWRISSFTISVLSKFACQIVRMFILRTLWPAHFANRSWIFWRMEGA